MIQQKPKRIRCKFLRAIQHGCWVVGIENLFGLSLLAFVSSGALSA